MVCSVGRSVSPTPAAEGQDDLDGPFSWEWMSHESVHDRSDRGAASGRLVQAACSRPDNMERPGGALERGDPVGSWPRTVRSTPGGEGADVERTGRRLVPGRGVSAGDATATRGGAAVRASLPQ